MTENRTYSNTQRPTDVERDQFATSMLRACSRSLFLDLTCIDVRCIGPSV